ncbi:MAG: competence/damage-inducible protein A [Acidobacteria bacterium]|jgi:nicotinamide-nucleotide amidase|nr:competence/damage-inducible protein A [Acidobacteriota bacterium]
MRAIFIAVGSELLDGNKIDTNSLYMAQRLQEKGILTDMKIIVGDDMTNLSWLVKNASKRAQLLIITGGLGPTEDDITREAVAEGLKRELEFKEELAADIQERFKKRGLAMPGINTRQAFIVQGAEIIPNALGTAPGQYIEDENCKILLLPGPPHEMRALFDMILEEKIAPICNYYIYKRMFKFGAITESETDSLLAELYTRYRNIRTTILASPGLIEVHLLGRSRKTVEEAQQAVDELSEKIKERMKDFLLTEKDVSLEELVLDDLKARHLTLAVAESCTGGGLGHRITNIPGSSHVFLGGVIAYSNDIKMKLLDVKENTLKRHGAVSKETAKEMAQGVRALTGADIGLSITGIAGPGGASHGKPVGLVFIHISSEKTDSNFYQIFPGEREIVKTRTINYALTLLRKQIEKLVLNEINH